MKNLLTTTGLWAAGITAALAASTSAWALTGIQVGPSGRTYASAEVVCGMHPANGMAPSVQAGLYNPRRGASATVSLAGVPVASVSFTAPDATVWLANGANSVGVALNRRVADAFAFDASPAFPGQQNVCIPDTRGNTLKGDVEYAQSLKSYATVTPGCALNPLTGAGQPFVNLVANGAYLLNVSLNNVPLTQLNGTTRVHTPVFLSAGLNVISAANGAASTDSYVRDGGTGRCALP
jgi:hypothetical protein